VESPGTAATAAVDGMTCIWESEPVHVAMFDASMAWNSVRDDVALESASAADTSTHTRAVQER
jgi:hypothetical protein